MLEINSNGSKWAGEQQDTIEDLLQVLSKYALDPVFENYGNFVNPSPEWLKPEIAEKYKGCTIIFGNFMEYSHVFNIVTDDAEIIAILSEAINQNKATPEYKAFKKQYTEREQRELEAQRLFSEGKINQRQMYAMY